MAKVEADYSIPSVPTFFIWLAKYRNFNKYVFSMPFKVLSLI